MQSKFFFVLATTFLFMLLAACATPTPLPFISTPVALIPSATITPAHTLTATLTPTNTPTATFTSTPTNTPTPPEWSEAIRDELQAQGKVVEYYQYPRQAHAFIGGGWTLFNQRVVAFFRKYLK